MSDDWGNTKPGTPEREQALHDHYASNARVLGHTSACEKVTRRINWPTLSGRPPCTCGTGR